MATGAASRDLIETLPLYRRASNYIAAAMIYLQDNHLLEEPLRHEHVKPRLLGHWGTVPGLNLMYAGLNRLILDTGSSILLVTGPGHGAPANLANLWIDGSLEDIKPELSRNRDGLGQLVRSFSWPGGFPSHLAPIVPGTIHEGGELGYALATAFGAVFDNPDLIAACIIGDGEAETGPTAGAWHSNKFLDPATSGAVLPILHVNGFKIANPTIYKAMSNEELTKLFEGYGWHPLIVEGEDLDADLARALDTAHDEIRALQAACRGGERPERPTWPMIIVRSLKGWTGIKELGGVSVEGRANSHQVPAAAAKSDETHLKALEEWLRSYRPEELFDESGAPIKEILDACPTGDLRMGANPHVNGGKLRKPLNLPELEKHAVAVTAAGAESASALEHLGEYMADIFRMNEEEANFRIVCPDEVASNKLGAVFKATNHAFTWPLDADVDPGNSWDGRVMEVLSEHNCQGWLQGYVLTGRHGVFPCYEAFIPIVDGMVNQYGKFLKMSRDEAPVARARAVAQLPAHVRGLAPGSQRLLTSGAGLHQLDAQPQVGLRADLPAARQQHAAGDDGEVLRVHELHQPRDRQQAPDAAMAVDRRGARPPRARSVGVRLRKQRRWRPRRGARRVRLDPRDGAAGRRPAAA